jgi:hypothetical protein
MASDRYVQAVARHLAETRLHKSRTGYRCRCGACRHQILTIAARTGIAPQRLLAALPPERPAEAEPRQERRKRQKLSAQVAGSMTVVRGRRRLHGTAALFSLLESKSASDSRAGSS